MYICTLAPKYTLIRPAHASLLAFAVQNNEKKLELGVIESSLEYVGRILVLGECNRLSLVEKVDFELSKTLEGSIVR